MGSTTSKKGFYKPVAKENGWANPLNANFDKLDNFLDFREVSSQDEADAAALDGANMLIRLDRLSGTTPAPTTPAPTTPPPTTAGGTTGAPTTPPPTTPAPTTPAPTTPAPTTPAPTTAAPGSYDNSTFEAGMDSWVESGNSLTKERSTTQAHGGTYSYKAIIDVDGASHYSLLTKSLTIASGNMTFWAWFDSGAMGYWDNTCYKIQVTVGGVVHDYTSNGVSGWNQFIVPVTAGTAVSISIKMHTSFAEEPGDYMTIYLDDIAIPVP